MGKNGKQEAKRNSEEEIEILGTKNIVIAIEIVSSRLDTAKKRQC